MKINLFLLFLFFISQVCIGQPIQEGEKLPLTMRVAVDNYTADSICIIPSGKKLTILDFWSTTCTGCIAAFPKLDSMQQRFGDKLQIILVTKQSKITTDAFFSKHKKIRRPRLPMVHSDSLLSGYFPYVYVPHHVWLDSGNTVVHITDGYNTNEKTVEAFLRGDILHLSKKDYVENPGGRHPLEIAADVRWRDKTRFLSLLTRCISGITFHNNVQYEKGNNNPHVLTRNCQSIAQLYATAFEEGRTYNFSSRSTRIIPAGKEYAYELPQKQEDWNDWKENYSFNYYLQVPAERSSELYKIMQDELEKFFSVRGSIEKRVIKCLALEIAPGGHRLGTKGGPMSGNFWVKTDSVFRYMQYTPFDVFSRALEMNSIAHGSEIPFADLSGIKEHVDIWVSREAWDSFDVNQLKKELLKQGLVLSEKELLFPVLVLRERMQ